MGYVPPCGFLGRLRTAFGSRRTTTRSRGGSSVRMCSQPGTDGAIAGSFPGHFGPRNQSRPSSLYRVLPPRRSSAATLRHSVISGPSPPPTGSLFGIGTFAMLWSAFGRSPGSPRSRSQSCPGGYPPTTRKSALERQPAMDDARGNDDHVAGRDLELAAVRSAEHQRRLAARDARAPRAPSNDSGDR